MSETTKVEQKPEDFAKKFEELCKETGFTIIPSLSWVARDDGTWSTRVNLTVGKLPQEDKKV
jgi:hypothetical protein